MYTELEMARHALLTRIESSEKPTWWGAPSASAVVHPSAKCGASVTIGHGVVIGPNVKIGDRTQIWHHANVIGDDDIGSDVMIGFACQVDPDVTIGDRTRVQPYTVFGRGACIGRGVFVGPYVCFTNVRFPPSKRGVGVVVEDDAIILSHVVILPGVRIAKGAVVSSGSLVTKDVAPGVWVMGAPARPYSTRDAYDIKTKEWDAREGSDHGR